MITKQAYRYELDPNDAQASLLAQHAGAGRFAWNWALSRRIDRFESGSGKDRFSDAMSDHRAWNAWKGANAPWVLELSKCAAQEKFRDLDRSFRSFWKARKAGRPVGFPKFKKKGRDDSFRLTGCIRIDSRGVKLPRIGRIRTKERTNITGRILSGTLRREAARWFVSLTVERERADPIPRAGAAIGIDVGLNAFAVLSDGERIEAPKPLAKGLKRLKRLSKLHARREKGSKNRAKAAKAVAKLHWRVANQRRDFLHKTTTRLAKTKPAVVIEDLNVGGLIRNKNLSRAGARSAACWPTSRRGMECDSSSLTSSIPRASDAPHADTSSRTSLSPSANGSARRAAVVMSEISTLQEILRSTVPPVWRKPPVPRPESPVDDPSVGGTSSSVYETWIAEAGSGHCRGQ